MILPGQRFLTRPLTSREISISCGSPGSLGHKILCFFPSAAIQSLFTRGRFCGPQRPDRIAPWLRLDRPGEPRRSTTALIYNWFKGYTGALHGHALATSQATPGYVLALEFHHFFKRKRWSLERTAKRRKVKARMNSNIITMNESFEGEGSPARPLPPYRYIYAYIPIARSLGGGSPWPT